MNLNPPVLLTDKLKEMHHILLIEDNPQYQKLIRECLVHLNLSVAGSLAEARGELQRNPIGLILLDVSLPDGDGFKFFVELQGKTETKQIPVIFLTGRSESVDKVLGFSLGAEDYITKPFDLFEFRARIETRLKRLQVQLERETYFIKGDIQFDVNAQQVSLLLGGQTSPVNLTPLEFKMLLHFARHEEHVFSRDQLIDHVWGQGIFVTERAVDTHISNLRRKIPSRHYCIRSVYGTGYVFSRSGVEAIDGKEKKGVG